MGWSVPPVSPDCRSTGRHLPGFILATMTSSTVSVLFLIAIGLCFTAGNDRSASTSTSASTSSSTETGGVLRPDPQGPIQPIAAECVGDACDIEPEVPAEFTEPANIVRQNIPVAVTEPAAAVQQITPAEVMEPATQCVEVTLPEGAVSGSRVYWKNPDGITVASATLNAGTSEGTCIKDRNYVVTRKGGFYVKGCKGTFQLCPLKQT